MFRTEVTTTVVAETRFTNEGFIRVRARRPGGLHQRFSLAAVDLGDFLKRVRLATHRDGQPLSRTRLAEEINGRKPVGEPRISAGVIGRAETGAHVRGVGYLHLRQMMHALGLTFSVADARHLFQAKPPAR